MLIICPNCKKRFEVDPAKLGDALKLKCSACGAVFRLVRKSAAAPAQPQPAAPPQAPVQQAPVQQAPVQQAQVSPLDQGTGGIAAAAKPGAVKVVVANESAPFCEAVRKVLAAEPFEVVTCNDGKVALETVERIVPQVLLLDVALPTMFGFEVCERVRENPALSGVKIVLIASIYDKTRYKRSPNSLYGADDYIEKHHIPDSLVPMIYRLASGQLAGVQSPTASELAEQEETRSRIRQAEVRETTEESVTPEIVAKAHVQPPQEFVSLEESRTRLRQPETDLPAPPVAPPAPPLAVPAAASVGSFDSAAFADPAPAAADPFASLGSAASESIAFQEVDPFQEIATASAPAPEAPPAPAPQPSEAEVKAKRLARIIVSDIVLYNQGKVEQGVREGSFYELLADDIREGERLYRQRVSEQLRETTTFLKDAFEDLIAKKRAELRI